MSLLFWDVLAGLIKCELTDKEENENKNELNSQVCVSYFHYICQSFFFENSFKCHLELFIKAKELIISCDADFWTGFCLFYK